jgi:hypothetical protein
VEEALAETLDRPLTTKDREGLTVLPPGYELRPFGEGHDFMYESATGLIVDVDILMPREVWRLEDELPPWPTTARRAALALSPKTIAASDEALSGTVVSVSYDAGRSLNFIELSERVPRDEAVFLSERCVAFLEGSALVGFFTRMEVNSAA